MDEITEQVKNFIPHLKVGSSYLFEHIRKGPFVGVFQGTSPVKEGDPQDTLWLEIDVLTEDGSGQERLANSFERDELGRKMRPVYSAKKIRPSLLKSITSPSSETQRLMAERFAAARKSADAIAAAAGVDPIYPALSLPTEKAFKHLDGGGEPSKPGFWSRLFGAN